MSSEGNASVRQLERPLDDPGDEAVTGTREGDTPVEGTDLLERGLDPQNLRRALHQVRRHQGAPGIDGMTVDDPRLRGGRLWRSTGRHTGRRSEPPCWRGPTRRSPYGGRRSRSRGVESATWGCRSYSTGASSQLWYRSCRRNGTPHFLRGATAFARSATPTRRGSRRRRRSGTATHGWWTWTWRSSLTGSTTMCG